MLYGDVCTIPEILERIKAAGKKAMVHIDLIAGLSAKEISVEFIQAQELTGSSRQNRHWCGGAKELGIFAVLRFFVIDSLAPKISKIWKCSVDRDRILLRCFPGVMPKVLGRIAKVSRIP